jgi:hypothetical protein
MLVPGSPFIGLHQALITRLATSYQLPSVGTGDFAEGGGLISYDRDTVDDFRGAAGYVIVS